MKGGTSQACAACKYQRRKCSDKCPLAPYFPADDPQRFQNAHRLFGVSNMMKTLKEVRDDQKRAAMDTIMYESYMRQRDPVHGCYGIIRYLYQQLEQQTAALNFINEKIGRIREQQCSFDRLQRPLPPLYSSSSSPHSQQPIKFSSSIPLKQKQLMNEHHTNNIPKQVMIEQHANNIPVQPFQQHHYHQHFAGTSVGTSNQSWNINEIKGSHVQTNKTIPKVLRGRGQDQTDVLNINGNSQILISSVSMVIVRFTSVLIIAQWTFSFHIFRIEFVSYF